ncbi:MinD/ParA family protein [Natroniella sulfidigena]|uniref:MinD/ParA family protein n=1 Tax=Natroniella sulfidigena TaxID=723921 RepID=UPI00200A0EC0|nr:MinD/ParA family protein [Natroniella sulfidigena]MCK8816511.1 MinD/ParA family protein [Natroniella sulfidigena]
MTDQAEKLRNLVQSMKNKTKGKNKDELTENDVITKENSAYVYTITSGKGGVGKSNFTANLALGLRQEGKEVMVIDADLGMANLDVILGVSPTYNLSHVIRGEKRLEEIIVDGPKGLALVPGGSGLEELANLSSYQINNLISCWNKIDQEFDIILIDTGAGLTNNVTKFVLAADEVIIISTPEPTSITDAYGVIKVIAKRDQEATIKLVVNQAENSNEGNKVADRLVKTARDFLQLEIGLLGILPTDKAVTKSVRKRRPFFLEFPKSQVVKSINQIVAKLLDKEVKEKESGGIKGFFNKLLNF